MILQFMVFDSLDFTTLLFWTLAHPLISMILNTKISIKLLTTMKHIILILSILSQWYLLLVLIFHQLFLHQLIKIQSKLICFNIDLYNVDTRLIDIKPEHFGIFVGISPSFNLIPSSYLKHTRDLFTQDFHNCLSSTSSSFDQAYVTPYHFIYFER